MKKFIRSSSFIS